MVNKAYDSMFWTNWGDENTSQGNHAVRLSFITSLFRSRRQTVLRYLESRIVSNDGEEEGSKLFLVYLQGLEDRTSTKLKITSLVAYPVHVVLMNCSSKYCHRLIENWRAVIVFPPVRVGPHVILVVIFIKDGWLRTRSQVQMRFMPRNRSDSPPSWMQKRRRILCSMTPWCWITLELFDSVEKIMNIVHTSSSFEPFTNDLDWPFRGLLLPGLRNPVSEVQASKKRDKSVQG